MLATVSDSSDPIQKVAPGMRMVSAPSVLAGAGGSPDSATSVSSVVSKASVASSPGWLVGVELFFPIKGRLHAVINNTVKDNIKITFVFSVILPTFPRKSALPGKKRTKQILHGRCDG